MELPVQITFHELAHSEALSRLINEEAAKLDRYFDRIVSCRVLVEREQRHVRGGAPYRVRIDIGVSGDEITVDASPSLTPEPSDDEATVRRKSLEIHAMYRDPALAVRSAFRRARRRLQDHARRMKGSHARSSIR